MIHLSHYRSCAPPPALGSLGSPLRIIDARSGKDWVKVGDSVKYGGMPSDDWTLLEVKKGFLGLTAKGKFRMGDGRVLWTPLAVRFTHPLFPGRRVAFIPT